MHRSGFIRSNDPVGCRHSGDSRPREMKGGANEPSPCALVSTILLRGRKSRKWTHGSEALNESAFGATCRSRSRHRLRREAFDEVDPNISPCSPRSRVRRGPTQKELVVITTTTCGSCVAESRAVTREGTTTRRAHRFLGAVLRGRWELHRSAATFRHVRGAQRGGHIEIITCAATHGYLPLLSRDESIHMQLRTAVETHRRHFGVAPRGIWLPECAYRPRYEWTPPAGQHRSDRRLRPGVEELLADYNEYFVPTRTSWRPRRLFLYRDYVPRKTQPTRQPRSGEPRCRRIRPIARLACGPAGIRFLPRSKTTCRC